MSADQAPVVPLPEPDMRSMIGKVVVHTFNTATLRAYAAACVEADRKGRSPDITRMALELAYGVLNSAVATGCLPKDVGIDCRRLLPARFDQSFERKAAS